MRLSKYLSQNGYCSRREAEVFIRKGWLQVDGEIVRKLGTTVRSDSQIILHPDARKFQTTLITVLLNKPVGYVSGQPEKNYKPALSLVMRGRMYHDHEFPHSQKIEFPIKRLAPAGRLDIDSSGLLVFTQDGRIAQKLIAPDSTIEKEYLVRVDTKVNPAQIQKLKHGLTLDNIKLKEARVELLDDDFIRMTLTQGRKRQIRRMCELVGLNAVKLKRVRIGDIRLGALPTGKWRLLTPQEDF